MNTLQEINKLDQEIASQSSVVRYAGYQYIINSIWKYTGYIIICVGVASIASGPGVYILVIGLILEAIATSHHNKSYKELQAEERTLIDLQTRRSALWAEFVTKCQCKTSHTNS